MADNGTGKKRTRHPASFKLQAIEKATAEGAVIADVATELGVRTNDIYRWRKAEKTIRKEAKKDGGQPSVPVVAAPNGASDGAPHEVPDEPKTGLRITGLTPLIRELVTLELSKELGPLVEAKLSDIVARELKRAFGVKP